MPINSLPESADCFACGGNGLRPFSGKALCHMCGGAGELPYRAMTETARRNSAALAAFDAEFGLVH